MKFLILWAVLCCAMCSFGQSDPTWRSWNQPVEPFRIIGNIYYIGSSDIASYLIATPNGHILLDGGFVETAPQIRANIRKLGFNPADVKYLLNSHAHADHAGGLAQLKKWTGAKFVASREDGALIARGGASDFAWENRFIYPPLRPDQIIANGETVSLGGTTVTAHLTPGHTKGCTTWTTVAEENGQRYQVVFLCSTSVPGYNLVNNSRYPDIVRDYRHTFVFLKALPCDVFLGAHGSFFDLAQKRAAMKVHPEHNPFIVPGELQRYVARSEREFEAELQKQLDAKK